MFTLLVIACSTAGAVSLLLGGFTFLDALCDRSARRGLPLIPAHTPDQTVEHA